MNDALLFVAMVLASYWLFFLLGLSQLPILAEPRDSLEALIERRFGTDWADGISCPFCLGAWISFAVVGTTDIFTSVPLPVLQALAVAGAVGIVGKVTG